MSRVFNVGLPVLLGTAALTLNVASDPLPPDLTYRPLPSLPFSAVKENDEAQKPAVMERQRSLLESRYDMADRPMLGIMMSGGRKMVQEGVQGQITGRRNLGRPGCQDSPGNP